MADLYLKNIYKVYPNGVKAVSNFNMKIEDKEFIVFVGPSGCGKSTTLRMIAGLEDITAGELYIGDELVNDMEPKDRDIAMVFQNYALYPHMTVYDNMAFGLKLRHVPREEIHKKVLWAADVLKLTEYLDRKPRAMSGGQRQRVSLGRAILRNPKVFLLDEPLSNLDAKLRTEMRAEIAKLHSQLGTTFIYVTHDQVEAMTLGTRVVVMKNGFVQQIDSPQTLYAYPKNKFVAGFIGTPQMNFFEATLKRNKEEVLIKFDYCENELHIPFNELLKVKPAYFDGNTHVTVGLRCEDVSLDPEVVAKSNNKMKIKVSHFEELGNETLVYGDLNMEGDGFVESSTRVIVKSYHGALNLKQGDIVDAAFNISKAHFFDKVTEETIKPRVPAENIFDAEVKDNTIKFLNLETKLPNAFKIKNSDNIELIVPTDSIKLGEGKLKATIKGIELIGDTKLCYLERKNRVFFAIVKKDYEEGTEINFDIDFKRISLKENGEILAEPIQAYDSFLGLFTNPENNSKAIKSLLAYKQKMCAKDKDAINKELYIKLSELGFGDALKKEITKEYKEKVQELKNELGYKLGSADLGKEGKKKAKEEFKNETKTLEEKYKNSLAELEQKIQLSKANTQNVNMADELKKEAAEKCALIDKEFARYKEVLEKGSEKYIPNSKAEEQSLIKESNELLRKMDEELKNELLKYNDLKELSPEEKEVKKAEKNKLISSYDKKKEKVGLEHKLFYISINGEYVKSVYDINKRVIQAFGVAVFKTLYRFELDHYSYKIVDNDGFEATVNGILDYGSEKFLKCEAFGNTFYVYVEKDIEIGSTIRLTFDLNNVRVYDNKFDIRLY